VLVTPVLRALGWDTEDIEQVRHEYRHRSSDKPVDYALLLSGLPQLFVEAKGLGENMNDRRWSSQVVSYASVAGVRWVALTNGDEWRLFNAHAPVDVEDKLFRRVRISEGRGAAVDALVFVARENIPRAGDILARLWEAERADRAVQQAIEELVGGQPPEWFVTALARRVEGLTKTQIRASLQRLHVRVESPPKTRLDGGSTDGSEGGEPEPPPPPPPPGEEITLQDLISAGLIKPPLTVTKHYIGHDLEAEVRADGTVVTGGTVYRSLSQAAAKAREAVKGGPPPDRPTWQTNGWTFWLFRDTDGQMRTMDVLRHRYREVGSAGV